MPRRCALAPLAITHLNVLFPRLPPSPTRPASHPLDSPRARRPPLPSLLLRGAIPVVAVTVAAPSHFLPLIPRFLTTTAVLLSLSLAFLPFVLSRHRERRPWHVSIYRRRPIDTDGPGLLSRRSSASSFALLPTTATLPLPLPPSPSSLHLSPFTPH